MARLFLILIVVVICAVTVMALRGVWTTFMQTGRRGMRRMATTIEGNDMGSTGIQKAAYIALIVMLFGVATGWLGGL